MYINNPDISQIYDYHQLVATRLEIRLLKVVANNSSELLTCQLKHVESPADYTALSYQWGSPTPQLPINIIDDKGRKGIVYVRQNLYNFLQTAKSLDQTRLFWIDAVCINQEDIAEKNVQVSRMGEIYSQAQDVRIWLSQDSDTANILATISRVAKETDLAIKDLFDYDLCPAEYADTFASERRRGLLQNSYWSRTWIVQEVVLAKNIVVQSGSGMTAWSNIAGLNAPISDKQSPFMQRLLGNWRANTDYLMNDSIRRYNLTAILDTFRENGCEKDLDHIYGFRALVSNGDMIEVDYSKSSEQLLREVVTIFRLDSESIQPVLSALRLDSKSLVLGVPFNAVWKAQRVLSENPIFLGNGISRRNKRHGFPLCQDEPEHCLWSQTGTSQPCRHCENVKQKLAEMNPFRDGWCVEVIDWLENQQSTQAQEPIGDRFSSWIGTAWPIRTKCPCNIVEGVLNVLFDIESRKGLKSGHNGDRIFLIQSRRRSKNSLESNPNPA